MLWFVFTVRRRRTRFNLVLQISLGEMVAYLPIPGGHIKLAERFVDPALSFTMGWNYWSFPLSSFPVFLRDLDA